MGRKIPAKKHRGVKDPLKQQAIRFERIQNKINCPPEDPDEQPVPHSLRRLFQGKQSNKTIKKKIVHSSFIKDVSHTKSNPVSSLRKLPGESGRAFSLRINSAVKALAEHSDHTQYPLDFEEGDRKGAKMAYDRDRRLKKQKKKMKKVDNSSEAEESKGTKKCRLAIRKEAKQAKIELEKSVLPELRHEVLPFGELAHAPPVLKRKEADRPGSRPLLLHGLLHQSSVCASQLRTHSLRAEALREDAVKAYREIKKARRKNTNR